MEREDGFKKRIDLAIERLRDADIISRGTIQGCSEEEIRHIEREREVELPRAYKHYLRRIGKESGGFAETRREQYPTVIEQTPRFKEYIKKKEFDYEPTETDFAFFDHQESQYLFFDTSAGPDPAVYNIGPPARGRTLVNESFSEWVLMSADDVIELQD